MTMKEIEIFEKMFRTFQTQIIKTFNDVLYVYTLYLYTVQYIFFI